MKVVITIVIVTLVNDVINDCGGLMGLHRGIADTRSIIRARLRHHTSLVPGLMGAMGNCTSRRRSIFATITSTHATLSNTGAISRLGDTRDRLSDTMSQLLTVTRDCPSLGTGRGFVGLRSRLTNARGHVSITHRSCGSTTGRCGAGVRSFPTSVVTKLFRFRGTSCFATATRTTAIPSISFNGWTVGGAVNTNTLLISLLVILLATLPTTTVDRRPLPTDDFFTPDFASSGGVAARSRSSCPSPADSFFIGSFTSYLASRSGDAVRTLNRRLCGGAGTRMMIIAIRDLNNESVRDCSVKLTHR